MRPTGARGGTHRDGVRGGAGAGGGPGWAFRGGRTSVGEDGLSWRGRRWQLHSSVTVPGAAELRPSRGGDGQYCVYFTASLFTSATHTTRVLILITPALEAPKEGTLPLVRGRPQPIPRLGSVAVPKFPTRAHTWSWEQTHTVEREGTASRSVWRGSWGSDRTQTHRKGVVGPE